jgi:hypothetical protein
MSGPRWIFTFNTTLTGGSRHRSLNKDPPLRRPLRAAFSASVSHLSAISMKRDLCSEVWAASANQMHSAALLRDWSKLGTSASICIDVGTDRVN